LFTEFLWESKNKFCNKITNQKEKGYFIRIVTILFFFIFEFVCYRDKFDFSFLIEFFLYINFKIEPFDSLFNELNFFSIYC
jgi:hypothetical protein